MKHYVLPGTLRRDGLTGYILKLVCSEFNILPEVLRSKCNARAVVNPRRYYFKLMRDNVKEGGAPITYQKISRYLANAEYAPHHATIIHAIRNLEDEMEVYSDVRELYQKMESLVRSHPNIRGLRPKMNDLDMKSAHTVSTFCNLTRVEMYNYLYNLENGNKYKRTTKKSIARAEPS